MNMVDEKRNELIITLENVFTEQELKKICGNHQTQLKGNLYHAISGDTVNARFSSLVDYLIRKNLVKSFLLVCLKFPHNQETRLKEFYSKEVGGLFDRYNFQYLIDILQKVKTNKLVIEKYNDYLKNKQTKKISSFDEWDVIDNLLTSIYKNYQKPDDLVDDFEQRCLLDLHDFIDFFLHQLLDIQDIKDDLEAWIRNNFPEARIFAEKTTPNNIVSYLFFIVEPKSRDNQNQEFFIKAQFAQFENNKTQKKCYEASIELENNSQETYLEQEIPDYIDQIIKEMHNRFELSRLPIIELFLPINILSIDFDIKEITDDSGEKIPVGKLYPLTVRSYERFFHNDGKSRSIVVWREKWYGLEKLINEVSNTEEFIHKIEKCPPDLVNLTDCLFRNSKQRVDFFRQILSKGVPLCLWTRYTKNNDSINERLRGVLNIDLDATNNFCKFYKIHHNIYAIREENMNNRSDFGYKLGVLFDHDKIPRKERLTSPNMSMKAQ